MPVLVVPGEGSESDAALFVVVGGVLALAVVILAVGYFLWFRTPRR
ncbi:MAG: hypothetical protein HOQ45_03090 [Nocardioidaceae bacterium]|nr:hypothetical protein [Nocardioidaceae bacterium]